MRPVAAAAQIETPSLYIEPGTSPIRNLNGGITADGKVVINMSTGEVWGFPTHSAGAPYPIESLAADGRVVAGNGESQRLVIRRRSILVRQTDTNPVTDIRHRIRGEFFARRKRWRR